MNNLRDPLPITPHSLTLELDLLPCILFVDGIDSGPPSTDSNGPYRNTFSITFHLSGINSKELLHFLPFTFSLSLSPEF